MNPKVRRARFIFARPLYSGQSFAGHLSLAVCPHKHVRINTENVKTFR
jgi:hypothetical protein